MKIALNQTHLDQIRLNSAEYEWTARRANVKRSMRTRRRSIGSTNIPKCIISRLVQCCMSSDTMQAVQQPLLTVQPFPLLITWPSISLARAWSPLLMITYDFILDTKITPRLQSCSLKKYRRWVVYSFPFSFSFSFPLYVFSLWTVNRWWWRKRVEG